MQRRSTLFGLVAGSTCTLATIMLLGNAPAPADPIAARPTSVTQDPAEIMAAMPKHDLLEKMVGEWNTTVKIFMGGPDSPPMESQGQSSVKQVLDGQFILEENSWNMSMPGMPEPMQVKGMGLTGYDANRNVFVASWADSMMGTLLTMTGGTNPEGSKLTMYGEMDEPAIGVFGRMVKYVMHFKSEDHLVFEIVDLHAGDDYKVVEIHYNRQ